MGVQVFLSLLLMFPANAGLAWLSVMLFALSDVLVIEGGGIIFPC